MKILWIVNTIFPEPSKILGFKAPVVGGWMYSLASNLSKQNNIKISIACIYNGNKLLKYEIDHIIYYMLPCKDNSKYNFFLEDYWQRIKNDFDPNIIHIHGTEYPHGLACIRRFPDLNYIISIQGLTHVIARYYYSDIPIIDIFKNITIRDVLRIDTIFHTKIKFFKRGIFEKEYLKSVKNVIGRTSWDFVHCKNINPEVSYHFCNESLRDGFYTSKKWSFDTCEPYSIFLSQATYPIKGLHQVIKAIILLINKYPTIKIRVGGANIIAGISMSDKLRLLGYGKYLKQLIKHNSLERNIEFLGELSESEIIKEYLRCNVFICPSSIENSPNSLGEAQILGVPTIGSYVGGIPDMITHKETGFLYRFEEVEMLAFYISNIFDNQELAKNISIQSIQYSEKRHDKILNLEQMMRIYQQLARVNSN